MKLNPKCYGYLLPQLKDNKDVWKIYSEYLHSSK